MNFCTAGIETPYGDSRRGAGVREWRDEERSTLNRADLSGCPYAKDDDHPLSMLMALGLLLVGAVTGGVLAVALGLVTAAVKAVL